ncbi:MAG: glycosyltransferase family 4 protein [Hyphomicrobium sp.]
MRLAVVASHPIQYHAPLYRCLAERIDLKVFYAHRADANDQSLAGFGVPFEWDVDLLSGYRHEFLTNSSREPGLHHFAGCDSPDINSRLVSGGFDAVLLQGWQFKSYFQAGQAARRNRLPILVRGDSQLETPRSLVKRTAKAVVYPAFLRLFDAALYVGLRSKAYWEHYGYPADRMFFSPHCVDTEWYASRATQEARAALRHRLGIPDATKVVLFAGKLVEFKRPLDIVAAAGKLIREGFPIALLIAGDGPLRQEMENRARQDGVPAHFLGFCNQTEMPVAYAGADVLILPSSGRETWGLVANEALACGKPIIISDAAGCAPDLVGDGAVGRAFPFGDNDKLARAIADTFSTPPTPAEIAARSSAYSLHAAVDGILQGCLSVRRVQSSP